MRWGMMIDRKQKVPDLRWRPWSFHVPSGWRVTVCWLARGAGERVLRLHSPFSSGCWPDSISAFHAGSWKEDCWGGKSWMRRISEVGIKGKMLWIYKKLSFQLRKWTEKPKPGDIHLPRRCGLAAAGAHWPRRRPAGGLWRAIFNRKIHRGLKKCVVGGKCPTAVFWDFWSVWYH